MLIITDGKKDINERNEHFNFVIKVLFFIEIGLIIPKLIYGYFVGFAQEEWVYLLFAFISLVFSGVILVKLAYLALHPKKRLFSQLFFTIILLISFRIFIDSFEPIAEKIIDHFREQKVFREQESRYSILINTLNNKFETVHTVKEIKIDSKQPGLGPILVLNDGTEVQSLDMSFANYSYPVSNQRFDEDINEKWKKYNEKVLHFSEYLKDKDINLKLSSNQLDYNDNINGNTYRKNIYIAHIYFNGDLVEINSSAF